MAEVDTDTDIEELKELVKRQAMLNADTNRIVHKLRRGIWWGRLWSIVWWVLLAAASGAAYYYYVQPYVEQVQKAYGGAQNIEQQIQGFFGQYFGTTTKR